MSPRIHSVGHISATICLVISVVARNLQLYRGSPWRNMQICWKKEVSSKILILLNNLWSGGPRFSLATDRAGRRGLAQRHPPDRHGGRQEILKVPSGRHRAIRLFQEGTRTPLYQICLSDNARVLIFLWLYAHNIYVFVFNGLYQSNAARTA